MENNGHDKITAFDTLFTTNHIQMLKILIPYFKPSMRKQLVVYIKYLELRYALSYFDSHSHELYGCAGRHSSHPGGADPFGKEEFNIGKICSELIPYCTSDEKQKIEQISGLFRSMEMYKEMSQTLEAMKEFMPDMPADFLSNFMQNYVPNTDSPSGPPGYPPDHVSAAGKPADPQGNASFKDPEAPQGNTPSGNLEAPQNNASSENPDGLQNNVSSGNPDGLQGNGLFRNPDGPQGNNPSGMGNPGGPGTQNHGNGMMDMLMNMLSPEQKAMLEMFGGNQTHESE